MSATRTTIFQKSTRKNQEFERFLCDGQEAVILDATTSKYIPLTHIVTPRNPHTPPLSEASAVGGRNPPYTHTPSLSEASAVGGRNPPHTHTPPLSKASAVGGRTPRNTHGIADKMPYESFRLINLQQRGNHAHSLVIFKSRAITTNPEQIAIFECNGQVSQSEIRILHTSLPPKEYIEESDSDTDSDTDSDSDPPTIYDLTELYLSPLSPRICMNFGNNGYNPGYCGMFGILAMVFFRQWRTEPSKWISKWSKLLIYMRQYIPEQPRTHGCMGTELAAQVQEIIAEHPSTHRGHQQIEKKIIHILEEALKTINK